MTLLDEPFAHWLRNTVPVSTSLSIPFGGCSSTCHPFSGAHGANLPMVAAICKRYIPFSGTSLKSTKSSMIGMLSTSCLPTRLLQLQCRVLLRMKDKGTMWAHWCSPERFTDHTKWLGLYSPEKCRPLLRGWYTCDCRSSRAYRRYAV